MDNKALKIGFSVFAAFAVIFGVARISQSIRINNAEQERKEEYTSALEDAKSRVMDTDEDGLTDWEEVNVFNTSAYLADTDSDGINDKDEIAQGTDPNCEKGKVCGSDIIGVVEEAQSEIDKIDNQGLVDESVPTDSSGFSKESQAALQAIEQGGTPTPAQIRALLKDYGIAQDQIDVATDEELMAIFNEVAAQNQ